MQLELDEYGNTLKSDIPSLRASTRPGRVPKPVRVDSCFRDINGTLAHDSGCDGRRAQPHRAGDNIGVSDRRCCQRIADCGLGKGRSLEWTCIGALYDAERLCEEGSVGVWTARVD